MALLQFLVAKGIVRVIGHLAQSGFNNAEIISLPAEWRWHVPSKLLKTTKAASQHGQVYLSGPEYLRSSAFRVLSVGFLVVLG